MYTILGFKRNSGKLDNGKEWENFSLHCSKDEKGVEGKSVQTLKVPSKVLQETFPDCSKVIGSNVNFETDIRNYGGKQTVAIVGINIIE